MSSFRKRNVQKTIPDTRISPQTGQLITSSGNLWLDNILGGGLTVGSICLIEEDQFNLYGKILAKYFLAEGEQSKHANWLATLDTDYKSILNGLPECIENTDELKQEMNEIELDNHKNVSNVSNKLENGQMSTDTMRFGQNDLRIAWRYNDLPLLNAKERNITIGHHFNLMKQMDLNKIECQTLFRDDDNTNNVSIVHDGGLTKNDDAHDVSQQLLSSSIKVSDNDCGSSSDSTNAGANATIMTALNTTNINTDTTVMNEMISVQSINNNKNNTDNIVKANVNDTTSATNRGDGDDADAVHNASTSSTTNVNSNTNVNASTNMNQLGFTNSIYETCLKAIVNFQNRKVNEAEPSKRLARFCLLSVGSPLWYGQHFDKDLLKFLTILRAAMRSTPAVCLITMPMHLIMKYDNQILDKIRNLVDYAIELKSFASTMVNDDDDENGVMNPVYKGYHGLVKIHKISALYALNVYRPETLDLAFKLKRKRFIIEKLHLPPELQSYADNVATCSSSSTSSSLLPSTNCAVDIGASQKSLDF